jgi:hypothetical protein
LAWLEPAVAVSLDDGAVNEDVAGAVVRSDRTEAVVGVEALHGALRHVLSPADATASLFDVKAGL